MPTSPFAGASSRGYCTVLSARSIENRAWQARLLLTYPPRVAKHWTEADIDPAAEEEIAALVERLYDLRADTDDSGDERPVLVRLTERGQGGVESLLRCPCPRTSRTLRRPVGSMEQAGGVPGPPSAGGPLCPLGGRRSDLDIGRRGGRAEHGGRHPIGRVAQARGAPRLFHARRETRTTATDAGLIEWIGQRGGSVTARDVQTGCRWLRMPARRRRH